ncbi:unnamed protein product [Thelazia callipaeda]|uniref:Transmembrane protein n=1 Tax=Thelazia callipaeda TaxID=103827 RepID=A0A0N5CQG7_THECL|nr:unnamed protein product [Thelazia callipaeda]
MSSKARQKSTAICKLACMQLSTQFALPCEWEFFWRKKHVHICSSFEPTVPRIQNLTFHCNFLNSKGVLCVRLSAVQLSVKSKYPSCPLKGYRCDTHPILWDDFLDAMTTNRALISCLSKLPILKWLELACSLIIVVFLHYGIYQWFIYTAIYFISVLLIVFTFLSLIAFFMDIQNFYYIDKAFNLAAFLICLFIDCLLTYDLIEMVSGSFAHHRYLPPLEIGKEGWKNRTAVCNETITQHCICGEQCDQQVNVIALIVTLTHAITNQRKF